MTRKEAMRQTHQTDTLVQLGFTMQQAEQLRRISMTLHRWFELECGNSNEWGSWAIERDETTDTPFMVHNHYRRPHGMSQTTRTKIADREKGARKRLAAIIADRNQWAATVRSTVAHHADMETAASVQVSKFVSAYIQTDPRGAALYIIRPGDVPDGGDVSAYYSRGICVY